jgi:hypothetical protein
MKFDAALATLLRVAPFAVAALDGPLDERTVPHPADSTRLLPLLPVPGRPIDEWVIGTAERRSDVTLAALDAAARALADAAR